MKPEEKRKLAQEELREENPDALFLDELDDALIGIGQQAGQDPIAIYSEQAIVKILTNSWGMSSEEAYEYYYFNIAGAWLGPETPFIVTEFPSL